MKIVYIGAGSHDFGRGQVVDVMTADDLKGRDVSVSLVDTNDQALDVMMRFALLAKDRFGSDAKIDGYADRRKALPHADFVITSVARKRYPLWELDFRVPMAHGFRHILGENGGPGALFHALRSIELMVPICRDVEELCPDACLLNFTNPEARVLHAVSTLTKVRAFGICHGVFSAIKAAAYYLEKPVDDLQIVSAGMNHFYQLLSVKDKKTGKELLGDLLERARQDPESAAGISGEPQPLFKKMVEIFDMFTYVSDEHIGEYLGFGAEFADGEWHYGQESRPVTLKDTAPEKTDIADVVLRGAEPREWMWEPSQEHTVPMICDIIVGRESWRPAVNVLNREKYIDNLAADGVVEVPAAVDGDGIHPQKVGSLSEPAAAMIRTQHTIHSLITEAYASGSKRLLLQALLLDPVVNSITAAEKMLDEMLMKQKDFLPSFR
jgi:alpha-galactosidase